jgi:outer membrane immunogenic protein
MPSVMILGIDSMKKLLLATTILALGAGSALAADLPAQVYSKAPGMMPVAVYNWTGFYIGGNAGGVWSNPSYTNLVNTSTFGGAPVGSTFTQNGSGFIGGGQVGYNWQASQWVFGVEASYSGANVKSTTTNFVDDVFQNQLRSLLLVTGRIGYASNNWLLYGKGGYAGSNRRTSVVDTGLVSPGVGSGSASAWHDGWTVGAGVEYGLTQNWIVGLEYDYVNVGKNNYELDGTDVGGRSYLFGVKSNYNIVTGRLSYKF